MLICAVVLDVTPKIVREAASAQDQISAFRLLANTLAETAAAADDVTTGVLFDTLVDDPASASDHLNGYLGELMVEAASAVDLVQATGGTSTAMRSAMLANSIFVNSSASRQANVASIMVNL